MNARAEAMTDERLESLERSRDEFTTWQKDMERRFAEAFPGGDHVGHCRYHELMIEEIAVRKRLRQAVMEKTVAGLVWALVVFVGVAMLNYLRAVFTRGG